MSVKPEEFHLNVRKNKQVLKELAGLITEEIQRRSSPQAGWDFRFLIIVAQWLIEQGRYTMAPEGNNPGNVVGKGDAGSFTRPYNKEYNPKTGVYEPRPDVPFARYSSMRYATTRKFDHLRDSWPLALQALLAGGSSDSYVHGLYPGRGKDYATAPKSGYASGMRIRLKQLIPHYILACEDDIKENDETAATIPGRTPTPGESLDYRNDLTLNKNMRSVLEHLLSELKDVQTRVNAGKGVQA
jgi:hypothetical protein